MLKEQGIFQIDVTGFMNTTDKYAIKVVELTGITITFVTRFYGKTTTTNPDGTIYERESYTPQASTFTEYSLQEIIDVYTASENSTLTWIETMH